LRQLGRGIGEILQQGLGYRHTITT
jgi:hypothetical protein